MTDFSNSKHGNGAVYPDAVVDTAWEFAEPLITAEKVIQLHLWGIPLVTRIKNPLTNKPDVMDPTTIKEYVIQAVALAETESNVDIFPRTYNERHPYDQKAMESFGYFMVRHGPVSSVESLAVVSSDGINVWNVPPQWMDGGYLAQRQINIMPFAVAAQSGVAVPVTSPVGAGLLPNLFKFSFVPGMFNIAYTSGFKDAKVPKIVNQLIGTIAAMEILSQLQTTYVYASSVSIGVDGFSQGVGQNTNPYVQRLQELADKRRWLVRRIMRLFNQGLFSDNV